jgi:hypothetical protein
MFACALAVYLRINNLQAGISLNLAEVQAFDSNEQLLTPLGAVISSQWDNDSGAEKCINGILTDNCHTTSAADDPNPWLRVTYGGEVTCIVVTNTASSLNQLVGATVSLSTNPTGNGAYWSKSFQSSESTYRFCMGQATEPGMNLLSSSQPLILVISHGTLRLSP